MKKNQLISILHIASGDLWAGAEAQLFTLAKTLNQQPNIKINILLLNHGVLEQNLLSSSINVTVLNESKFNSFQILLQLTSIISNIKPDVIHTHRVKENIMGSIAALVNNVPTLRTIHGAPEHKPAWHHIPKQLILFMDWLCGRFLQNKIIAVSKELTEILRKSFPAEKIIVIENGIDIDALTRLIQPSLKNPQNTPAVIKIGIAGRLVPVKRVDIFILTAQYMKKTYPNLAASFHIYGDGPLNDELKLLNKKSQTEDIVHFEGHCDNLYTELQKMDVLLMTSDHEGLPMILLEAMALQTPIIAHAVGGIPNLLDHGKCGTLVDAHNAQSYAEAIINLINQPKQHQQLAHQAFKRLEQNYSARHTATAYLSVYKQIIN